MERLEIHPNGQWKLEKAKPPVHESYLYNLRSGDPKREYSDLDLKNNQSQILDTYKNKLPHAIKKINGQDHVLMHRGVKAGTSEPKPREGNKERFNEYSHDDTHITFHGDNINTPHYNEAKNYTPDDDPLIHSFWVPKDKLHADGGSHEKHFLDKEHTPIKEITSDLGDERVKDHGYSPEEVETDPATEEDFRDYMAQHYGAQHHPSDSWHISMQPGKYQKATPDEVASHLKQLKKS